MPLNNNYFKIGLFTIIAFVLLVAGLMAFGLSGSLKPKLACESLFARSVQGLTPGSPVKFRGFKVGQVTSIALSSAGDTSGEPMVRVLFDINPHELMGADGDLEEAQQFIVGEINKGLQVFLSFQGITGVGFLDLDYKPDSLRVNFADKTAGALQRGYIYMPTGTGQIMEISEAATQIVKSLSAVDFGGLSKDIKMLVNRIDSIAVDVEKANLGPELKLALQDTQKAMKDISELAGSAHNKLNGFDGQRFSNDLEKILTQLRVSLNRADHILRSPQNNLPEIIDNLRVMSENMRDFSESAKSYPSQILFGDPPPKVHPEKRK